MRETRKSCGGEQISDCGCSAVKSAGAVFRLLAWPGIMSALLLVLTAVAASAQQRAPVARKAPALRQISRTETIYRIDVPVRLEETTIKVELSSPAALDGWWKFLRETESESPGGTIVPKALVAMRELGETAVLHSGVCLLSDREQGSIYSSKRLPAQIRNASSRGETVAAVEYRDLGRRLSANLEGIDTQGRVCFSYNIDLNYIVGEPDTASPGFASFTAEGRARVKIGEALVIPNFDGSNGLLVFLTPRLVR